ncbi:aryl hydrocarbon receptor 2 [Mugil cephalus]|uniref:aryl hydrocarbon receptor 2 n=1 Tax=Mugil cephalus TaxID=48193 RepID=UPI001FB7A022|nr:aryl hydrocarbon receptor 2 [Mugil cephalus]
MLPNTALYAVKKRKKPVQKIPKPPPPDGAKSNPSKRHRDRLNGELDKLTSLLPFSEEVRARLDKLSVLRLSVGYLKVKSFFNATMKASKNNSSWTSERSILFGGNALTPSSSSSSSTSTSASAAASATPFSPSNHVVTSVDGVSFSEGDLLLQALNGFVLVVTAEGYVFYTSPTIQDFLGFHQSDVVHQSVFELIHTDDRALFRRQLHFSLNPNYDGSASPSEQNSADISTNVVNYDPQAIPPENSSFLERNFCCRFRCLLDNSSGFLALNFHGRLKFLHGQNRVSEDGTLVPPQLALFAIATPLQSPSILEIRTKTLIFQTKHKLDFTPMGIDTRGKVVLGYSEAELCMKGSGYHFIHAADMMYCAENHIRMIKTGDSGFTVFRLLTKNRTWVWVQANARLVFKGGKPDFIVARQRALTNEEGEEQLRLRRLQLPFNFTTGEALLYDTTPTVDVPDPCSAPKQRKVEGYSDDSVSRDSILGCMLSQDQSIYCEHNTFSSLNDVAFKDTHATVNVPVEPTPKPAIGGLMKTEATVQDMMETLQEILGDSDLVETLDVGPDELKSWETTLLKMNFNSSEFSDDLNDIINNDILMYVEEQLQKEGGLQLPDQLDAAPPCLSPLDLQAQDLDRGGEQNFSWSLEPQNQVIPNGGTMRLSHTGFNPQLNSSGLNGPSPVTFNPSLSDSCPQAQNQLRASQVSDPGTFSFRQIPNSHPNHFQTRAVNQPVPDQSSERQLNQVFNFQGNQWSPPVSNPNPADSFVETFAPNISNQKPGFPADPSSSSCLQGHFSLQRQSWSLEPQQQQQQQQLITPGHQQMSPCLNPIGGFQSRPSTFRTPMSAGAPVPVHQDVQHPPPSRSCMYRNAAPASAPLNGIHHNQARINNTPNPVPSKSACFYQTLPGGGSVPDDAALSCQLAAGLNSNGLLVQPQPYLTFSEQTQINNHPVVGNGGFSFSSLPNGNTCYSENK